MKAQYVVLIMGFLALSACDLESDCSGTVSATYTVGSNVSSDFNASNVAATATVLTSDCEALPAGQTADETLDSVTRSGNTITITEDSEVITMTVTGSSVDEYTRTQTIAGCEIAISLTGTLNTTDNTIQSEGSFAAKGLTCDQAL